MAHNTKIRIAALVTALFIGGLTAAGIGLRSTPTNETPPAAPAEPVSSEMPSRAPASQATPSQAQLTEPLQDDPESYESDDGEEGEDEYEGEDD